MGLFTRRSHLPSANVASDWARAGYWLTWEAPRNLIAGESHYADALATLAGPPREQGYLLPVEVVFIREPQNKYDGNALRAEVAGQHIGYLRRNIAGQLAGPLDAVGCQRFSVCGLIRGGLPNAPNLGVHVWLSRRLSSGPEIALADDAGSVRNWPPRDDEG